MEGEKKFTVRMAPDAYEILDSYARQHDWSRNRAITNIIRQHAGKGGREDGCTGHSPTGCLHCDNHN